MKLLYKIFIYILSFIILWIIPFYLGNLYYHYSLIHHIENDIYFNKTYEHKTLLNDVYINKKVYMLNYINNL